MNPPTGDPTGGAEGDASCGGGPRLEDLPPPESPGEDEAGPPLALVREEDEERCGDLGNARRLVRLAGEDLRHVRSQHQWYRWQDRRWVEDTTGEAERRAKAVVNALYTQAATSTDSTRRKELAQHAVRSDTALRVRSMLELAATEPEFVLRAEQLDAGPWLLNCLNGTLDLHTATLRPHRRDRYLTKLAPVPWEPTSPAPRWARFLEEITAGNGELAGYLQRAVGYSLTGDTREQVLFFCHGLGANGKTVFLETLHAALGDYAATTPFTTLLATHGDGPRNDLARLRAVRLVSAAEAPSGHALDEALLKTLVGGDTITARFLHQEFFEFRPTFKLWLRANHKPPVREQTYAFWRRLRLVPFGVTFRADQQDRELARKLRDELPGILAWAVHGCAAWLHDGLGEPPAVTQATAAYQVENDTLGEFLEARCALKPQAWTSTADLYRAFVSWWEDSHGKDRPLTRSWFGRALGERPNILAAKRGEARGWCGVRIVGAPATPPGGDSGLPF